MSGGSWRRVSDTGFILVILEFFVAYSNLVAGGACLSGISVNYVQ